MRVNVVDPSGEILTKDAPFTFLGNRGVLHREGAVYKAQDGSKPWIYCAVSALRDPSVLMTEGRNTELFFLDEATALSAGHRPCRQCLRSRFYEFVTAWDELGISETGPIGVVDAILRAERSVTCVMEAESLPTSTFIRLGGRPYLVTRGAVSKKVEPRDVAYPWSPQGYGRPMPKPTGPVEVLTPPSIVKLLDAAKFSVPVNNLVMRW